MLNIIRADLYKMFRSKGFYITIILLLAFIILQVVSSSTGAIGVMVYETTGDNPLDVVNSEKFTGTAAPFEMMAIADNLLYFLLPFIIFIGSADFSAGTTKNVLSNGMPRVKYYLSKLILSCIFCAAVLSLNIILPIIVGTIKNGFGGTFDMEFAGRVLRPFSSQLFMCLAVTCVGVFFVFASKRTAAVNGAYIAFCFVPTLIIFILVQINSNLTFLFDYDVVMNIRMLANLDTAPSADVVRAFAIGGFYIMASTASGILIFKKSEIK